MIQPYEKWGIKCQVKKVMLMSEVIWDCVGKSYKI